MGRRGCEIKKNKLAAGNGDEKNFAFVGKNLAFCEKCHKVRLLCHKINVSSVPLHLEKGREKRTLKRNPFLLGGSFVAVQFLSLG